jgi:uncharacterized protein YjbJ (UPF0337 family)
MTSKTEVKGNWKVQKAKLKQNFAVLTDNDLLSELCKKDEMLAKPQVKMGKNNEELQKNIDAL